MAEEEQQLDGGNVGGAVRAGNTVRRAAGPWTPAWDFAGPATPEWDLAFAAFSWVPLHARHVVAAEGFTDFAARPGRLRRFLRAYGWTATEAEFLEVLRARVQAHADGIRGNAAAGDEVFGRLLSQGVADDLDRALAELRNFPG